TQGPGSAASALNESARLLWAPPALFLQNWEAAFAADPSEPTGALNGATYRQTLAEIAANGSARTVLGAFYQGADGAGFNGSADCAAEPASVESCSDAVARDELRPELTVLFPPPADPTLAGFALTDLNVGNFSVAGAQQTAVVDFLAASSGLSARLLVTVLGAFPTVMASPDAIVSWAVAVSAGVPSGYPESIPAALEQQFVAPDGTAEILIVDFSVGSGYVTASGADPVMSDVDEIDRITPGVIATSDPGGSLRFYQTGGAALDTEESQVLSSSLSVVLPLTIVVLIGITMVYFRTPLAPLVTFGGLGIALGLGVGAVVLVGTLVTHVDVSAIELEETFVLGVGTDYSIFLVSRFREELHRGATRDEAVVTAVTWAGQSVATSGATAVLATAALAYSGVALLSQWGIVLSVAILLTVLLSLTLVPACLALLGGRIFWPTTGDRFRRQAARVAEEARSERTYFFRAARRSQRRPWTVIALVLVVSVPLV
ncbi:MAG: MMPL family transporter, partial [Thermoplasmata archaeon]